MRTLPQRGIDPLGEILKASQSLSGRDKIKVYLEILPYIYSKRKQAEAAPLTLESHIDNLSMPQMANLHRDLERRMGHNRPVELTMEQLQAYKESIDKLISHREILEDLKDTDDA